MKLVSKTRVAVASSQGAPLCGCITYIDSQQPKLLHRMGYEVASDVHDDYYDSFSEDNGQTWSEPSPSLRCIRQGSGHVYFVENAIYYAAEHNRLVHFVDEIFQQDPDNYSLDCSSVIRITVDEPQAFTKGTAEPTLRSKFGLEQGVSVSFCHPIVDSRRRLLVPVQWQREEDSVEIAQHGFSLRADLPTVLQDVLQCGILIGTWNEDHTLNWQLGNAVPYDFTTTSRGLCEGTVAELNGGRLAIILRGSNAAWPDKPGYKWVAFSDDGGMNWSQAQSLGCDDGTLLESSATGSALFRSQKNGGLYWIGNLCLHEERPHGNWPRSPLIIAQVQEEPFALIRRSIEVIDQRTPPQSDCVQFSNFKFYQDRETDDVVLYLTAFGERGFENGKWLDADLYQYRVSL